jgi:hypothetical protein
LEETWSSRWLRRSIPLPAIALAECLATADIPAGVVNILTGRVEELVPWLASHGDVDAIDVTGVPSKLLTDAERDASDNVKRVVRPRDEGSSPYEVTALLEMKTVWHPKGAYWRFPGPTSVCRSR